MSNVIINYKTNPRKNSVYPGDYILVDIEGVIPCKNELVKYVIRKDRFLVTVKGNVSWNMDEYKELMVGETYINKSNSKIKILEKVDLEITIK